MVLNKEVDSGAVNGIIGNTCENQGRARRCNRRLTLQLSHWLCKLGRRSNLG